MKTYTIILFLIIFSCEFSCKTESNFSDLRKGKKESEITYVLPSFIHEIKEKIDEKTHPYASDTYETNEQSRKFVKKLDSIVSVNEEKENKLPEQISQNYHGKIKDDLLSRLKNIHGNRSENNKNIIAVEDSLKGISDFLNPLNLNKVRDDLIDKELNNLRKTNPNKELLEIEKQRIIDFVAETLIKIIQEKAQELLRVNQILSVLLMNDNSYMFEIRTIEANLYLQNFIWRINSLSYFKSGSDTLSTEGRILIIKDINFFFDSLFNKVERVISNLVNDTIHHHATLTIYIDGYADSQGFIGASSDMNYTLNVALSQRRADKLKNIIIDILNERTRITSLRNISYLPPIFSSIGHGEELPDPKGSYEREGMDDISRRLTVLQCTFSIK